MTNSSKMISHDGEVAMYENDRAKQIDFNVNGGPHPSDGMLHIHRDTDEERAGVYDQLTRDTADFIISRIRQLNHVGEDNTQMVCLECVHNVFYNLFEELMARTVGGKNLQVGFTRSMIAEMQKRIGMTPIAELINAVMKKPEDDTSH